MNTRTGSPQLPDNWGFQFGLRRLFITTAVLALVLAALTRYFAAFDGLSDEGPPQIAFDPVGWKRADPIEPNRTVRMQMIEDLLRRHNLRGWDRADVVELLGEPDSDPSWFDPQYHAAYQLGRERGVAGVDFEYLALRFDDEDKVAAWKILRY